MAETQDKISEDTITCLEQAKKGKARRFVMVSKGATIVSVVVYKKGSIDKYKKEAKEAGSGQVSFGVVTGSGAELNFQLARADGFQKPPVKPTALKDFLSENGDFKCKPLIEIVDTALVVLDDDDPVVKRFLALQQVALEACDKHPDRAEEIGGLCEQIGKLLEADDAKGGAAKLSDLEKLLAGLGAAAPTGQTPTGQAPTTPKPTEEKPSGQIPKAPPLQPKGTPPPKTAPPQNEALVAITARITALKPSLENARAAKLPQAQDWVLQVSQAGLHARKGEFSQATALLDKVEPELKKQGGVNSLAGSFETLRGEIQSKFDAFAKTAPPEDVAKLQKILDLAKAKAAGGDYTKAIQALNQLEPHLTAEKKAETEKPETEQAKSDQTTSEQTQAKPSKTEEETAKTEEETAPEKSAPKQAEPTVLTDEQFAERAKQVRETWLDAKEIVDKQIAALQKAMKNTDDVVFARLAEYGLGGVTKRMQTGLLASLMNMERARGEARQKSQEQALQAIADFRTLLKDEAFGLIKANKFKVPVDIPTTLGAALTEMERSLKA